MKMPRTRRSLALFAIASTASIATAPLAAQQEVDNVAAFARLYGVARWFYPSDAAAALDWNRFAVHGVSRAKSARTPAELERTLEELFTPLGPGIEIGAALPPKRSSGNRDASLIAWRYRGPGFAGYAPYTMKRTNRATPDPNALGVLSQSVRADTLRGKTIRLRGHVRVADPAAQGWAGLWVRVDRSPQAMGFYDNMRDRPARDTAWREYVIEGPVAPDATQIVFGARAVGPITGKGDPARALAGLSRWPSNTEEVLDMIKWMRQYNADARHVQKVKFYGFDMQNATRAAKVTLAYLRRVDTEQATAAEHALAQLANPITEPEYSRESVDTSGVAMVVIRAVLTRFDTNKSEYIGKTSEREWAVARQHASIVAQNLEMRNDTARASLVRDSSMSVNIRWILDHEGPGTRMVVWAHNLHVNTEPSWRLGMGNHLRKAFGSQMVVFGFAFNEGSFQAREEPAATSRNVHTFTVGPAPSGSLDATLAAAGLEIAAVDLRVLPTQGMVAQWFSLPQQTRSIGAGYSEQSASAAPYFLKIAAPKGYDALLFVEKTSAARPNANSFNRSPPPLRHPTNLDFEAGPSGNAPDGWNTTQLGHGFESTTTGDQPSSGKRAAILSRGSQNYYGERAGSLTQRIDAVAYRGKQIKLRVMARTDAIAPGNQAYVRLQIAMADSVMFDNLTGQPVISTAWQSYEIEVDVPRNAATITYGVYLIGTGRVWMDAVSIEVVTGNPDFSAVTFRHHDRAVLLDRKGSISY